MKTQRVTIGIVENSSGHLLLAKRANSQHLAGKWEFPGGKLAVHESFKMALRRELLEEVGIQVTETQKIIEFNYQYVDRDIHFQVYKINQYVNSISAKESQLIRWEKLCDLNMVQFPAANKAIIDALQLPNLYMIADQSHAEDYVLGDVQQQLKNGIKIIQYRAHQLTRSEYTDTAIKIRKLCEHHDAMMVCNCELSWINDIAPHAVHLNSKRLRNVYQLKNSNTQNYFSASCHSKQEIELANQLGVRCILLGPVHYTASHPNTTYLQWEGFNQLCSKSNVPVYALGGVAKEDVPLAIAHGAQGIAGISTFRKS